MKNFSAVKIVVACAGITWATASFSQHFGHSHSAAPPTRTTTAPSAAPYAGEHTRPIKSLSEADTAGLQSGAGMAYAKAAELNGYPGPAHVIELAGQLQLSDQQREASQSLMAQHNARARDLGAQLLDAERRLDSAFASKQVDALRVDELTRQVGLLQARLRAEHLLTHLTQTALLTPQQITGYQRLRGYEQTGSR